MKLRKTLTALAALLALSTAAYAQPLFTFTFDTGTDNFWNAWWSPTGPTGWTGGAAIQQTNSTGGWTLGSGPGHEFDWASGQQVPMQALANSGQGRLSFDVMLDGSSFTVCRYGDVHCLTRFSPEMVWKKIKLTRIYLD